MTDLSWVKFHDCGEPECCECLKDHCCHLCPLFAEPSFDENTGLRSDYVDAVEEE